MATAKKEEEKTLETSKETEEQTVEEPKTVEIELFKDNDKYKDDVFVGLNGKTYQIKRGEKVKVPIGVAEILENSQRQDASTQLRLARLQDAANARELK